MRSADDLARMSRCRCAPERCLSELTALGLPADVLDTVLHGNAARILGLA